MKNKHLKLIIHILCIIIFIITIIKDKEIKEIEQEEQQEQESISYIIENTINNEPVKEDEQIKEEIKEQPKEVKQPKKIINYEMILEIPKINLKKGILSKNNKDNNIEKNVTILKESSYPDTNGNIYIAAHSGNGSHSYFNNLVKLKENDQANLYYHNQKYTYQVISIKEIDKKSKSSLLTSTNNNLVLITCSKKTKNKYLVIILKKRQD